MLGILIISCLIAGSFSETFHPGPCPNVRTKQQIDLNKVCFNFSTIIT